MYNAAPGNVYLTNFTGYANALGVNALATALGKNFGAVSNDTLAATVAANLGLTGDALAAGTAYLLGQFNVTGADRGVVILNAVNGLSGLTGDATYGAAATAFNDSVSTGLAYSTNSANTSTDLAVLQAASVPTGNTVAMVAGTDNLTGTARGDTFTGTLLSTATDVDRIDGGNGSDTLRLTLGTAGTTTPTAITNVETIRVTGSTGTANNVLDVKNATGLTLLQFNDVTTTNTSTHTIQGITSPSIGLQVSNATATSTTLNFTHAAAGLTGSADTVNLTLSDNGTASAPVAAVQVNTAGIEGLTVASNGSGNYITNLTTAGDVKALTITGSAPLSITTLGGADSSLVKMDASATTGGVSLDANFASNVAVSGGAGNDSFVFGANLDVNDTVNGGEGTDSITVDAAVASNVTLSSIETLVLLNDNDAALDQANLAGITTVVGAGDTANEVNAFTNATPGKHSVVTLATDAAVTVSYALKTTLNTSRDTLNVTVGTTSVDGTTRGILTANDIETLNVTSASKTASTANTLAQLNAQAATSVVLTGSALTITALDLAPEHTINASAMTGVLTLNTTADDQTIIGGAANDAITFDTFSELTSSDSIDGGAGNDTVTVATNGATAVSYGRVAMSNVENLNMTIDNDAAGGAATHSIDLRNSPVTSLKVTTAPGANNANTDSISVSNIQAGTTKITLHNTVEDYAGGTVTFDSDRNTTGNLVLTGATGINLNGTTIATTGDWESFAIKQTGSASTATNVLNFTAETTLTSLTVDASEQAMTFTTVSAAKLASLTITGDNAVTVTALSQSTAVLANVDASASSAAVTLTATTRTAAATVTTGTGDDSIELTLTTEGGNTINAGSNSTVADAATGDTLNLNGTASGATVIDLSSTTDQITSINGVANAATQIGFEHVNASGSTVVGTGTYSITGSSGINVITGDSGADTIDGGAGADTITGAGGNDVLTGGTGADVFDFNSVATNGSDSIVDFVSGTDFLDFDGILDGVDKTYEEVAAVGDQILTAAEVIVYGGVTTIAAAATAIAADATVTDGLVGLIVFSDGVDTFVYHSTDLGTNGTETLLVTLSGITDPTTLVTGDFVFA
jgi:Ca2+-binding RTX toxin-like protein